MATAKISPEWDTREKAPKHPVLKPPVSIWPVMFGPNITGYWGARGPESMAVVYGGALSNEDNSSDNFGYGHQNGSPSAKLTLDASRSSSIYGSASTVQPESTRLIPCIKL